MPPPPHVLPKQSPVGKRYSTPFLLPSSPHSYLVYCSIFTSTTHFSLFLWWLLYLLCAPLPIFSDPLFARSPFASCAIPSPHDPLIPPLSGPVSAYPPYISSAFALPSPHLQRHEYIIIYTMGPCLLFMNYQPCGQTKPIFIRNLHFISAPIRLGAKE